MPTVSANFVDADAGHGACNELYYHANCASYGAGG